MKKLLILFIVLSSLNSYSQFIPMLGPNVRWTHKDISFADQNLQYFPFKIWTDGDTLINDTTYYQIYKRYNLQSNITIQGYIREDSGKVYVRHSETFLNTWCSWGDLPLDEDLLLFDTSVDVGDTIEVWNIVGGMINSEIEILEIDTQFISGIDRRVFSFGTLPDSPLNLWGSWIEGIGSPQGLFSSWCPISEVWTELLCYAVDKVVIWGGGSNCVVGIEEYNLNNQISIVPNPSDRFITIQNDSDPYGRYNISIYDLNGRESIRQEDLNLESRIDVSELTFGMYFIQIEFEDGGKAVKKFVKNK